MFTVGFSKPDATSSTMRLSTWYGRRSFRLSARTVSLLLSIIANGNTSMRAATPILFPCNLAGPKLMAFFGAILLATIRRWCWLGETLEA